MIADLNISYENYSLISAMAKRKGITFSEMAHRLIEQALGLDSEYKAIPRSRPDRVDPGPRKARGEAYSQRTPKRTPDSAL